MLVINNIIKSVPFDEYFSLIYDEYDLFQLNSNFYLLLVLENINPIQSRRGIATNHNIVIGSIINFTL